MTQVEINRAALANILARPHVEAFLRQLQALCVGSGCSGVETAFTLAFAVSCAWAQWVRREIDKPH